MSKAKIFAAVVAAACAACAVLFPEYATTASAIAGLLLGKEYLPQAGSK